LKHLIREINGEWIKHAFQALKHLPSTKRHISTILCSISEESYMRIQEKIEELRQLVFKIIEEDNDPSRVVQLNIQLFPRSEPNGGKQGTNHGNKRK
jgi:uncharacterized protein (TIGR02147 family)